MAKKSVCEGTRVKSHHREHATLWVEKIEVEWLKVGICCSLRNKKNYSSPPRSRLGDQI